MIVIVLEQLGLEAETSYSTSLPRNFPPSRDIGMVDRPMVCVCDTTTITTTARTTTTTCTLCHLLSRGVMFSISPFVTNLANTIFSKLSEPIL